MTGFERLLVDTLSRRSRGNFPQGNPLGELELINMENRKVEIGCAGVPVGFLGVAFVVLKLCHVIDWHWLWVLSPFLFCIGVYIFWFIVALAIIIAASYGK